MWQDIAVCVIGISVIGYIAYKVYRMFASPKPKDPCCGCSGCSLKKGKQSHEKAQVHLMSANAMNGIFLRNTRINPHI